MAIVTQAESAIKVVLRSRSTPGRVYRMSEDAAEHRLRHLHGEECEAARRGVQCWHEERATWAAVRMAPVWRGMLAHGCPSADVLQVSDTRRVELVRETERRLAAAERLVAE